MDAARQIGALLVLGLLLTSRFTPLGAQSIVSATPVVLVPALEHVVYWGDIVLKGNETMTLDLVAYTQKGDIVVTDDATLRITASILRVDSSEDRLNIIVNGSGRLWLQDSVIEGEMMIYMAGDASAYLNNCTLIGEGLFPDGTRYYLTGFDMEGNSSLEARRSRLGSVMIADNASSEVYDSFLGDFYPVSPVESIIIGSEIESLRVSFRDTDLEISEGFHGYHESWDTGTAFGEGSTSTVRLVETVIIEPLQIVLTNCSLVLRGDVASVIIRNGSKVRVLDTNLRLLAISSGEPYIDVENSTIDHLRGLFRDGNQTFSLKGSRLEEASIISMGEMSVTIEDCSFGSLQLGSLFSSDGPANVDVRDTIIRNLTILSGGRFTYDFENVTVEEGFQQGEGSIGKDDHAILRGSLRFGEDVENSTIDHLRGLFRDGNQTFSLKGSRLEEASIISMGEMSVTIEDCSFGSLQLGSLFSSDGPANVDVRDTIIRNLTILSGGRFTYDFENVTVEEGFQQGEGSIGKGDHAILRGSLRFGEDATFREDRRSNANITRWYDVEFSPTREGSVTLELKGGNETIWTRGIDREGGVEFSINYIDYFRLIQPYIPGEPSAIDLFNMTDTFTLVVTTPGASAETRVGLLTSTPILLELEAGASPGEKSTLTSAILLAVALVAALILWTRFRR